MKQDNKGPEQKSKKPSPSDDDKAAQQKQLAEQEEVAGRHKNDGQKDHKGAR